MDALDKMREAEELALQKEQYVAEHRLNKQKQAFYGNEMAGFRYGYENDRPDRSQFEYDEARKEEAR